jgi:hypothetical protein
MGLLGVVNWKANRVLGGNEQLPADATLLRV